MLLILVLLSCAPSDSYRDAYMQNQMQLLTQYQKERKPVFEITNDSKEQVTLPAGLAIRYYGEQDIPVLPYHESEVTKIWTSVIGVFNNAIPAFMYGYFGYKNRQLDVEINEQNNATSRELYKGLTYGSGSIPTGSTSNEANTSYTVSEGGILVNGGSTYDTNDEITTATSTDSHDTSYTDSFNTLRYTTVDDHTSYDNDVDSSDHSNTDAVFTPTVVTPVITVEPTVIQPVVVTNPTTP